MLSTLSCGSGQDLIASDGFRGPRKVNSHHKAPYNVGLQLADSIQSSSGGRRTVAAVHLFYLLLLIAGNHIQCSESLVAPSLDIGDDWDPADGLVGDNSACFCNGTFFQSCPAWRDCIGGHRGRGPAIPDMSSEMTLLGSDPHDFNHPDHVDIGPKLNYEGPGSAIHDDDYDDDDDGPSEVVSSGASGGHTRPLIVRHRKVYVKERERKEEEEREPVIHPISINIPVYVKDDSLDFNLTPKPMFNMRKYTVYDKNPQVEMVPMTTTVIKPVGVSKDQFIDDQDKVLMS